ncbi:MFS family permease [Paenibacillus turicensis]|uniref:MFS family permease n=2 Tax=Paenibacillus turicensis TaxID=160487 RepID=A0ABS4FQ27_9BACL|nr:MFS family permease [Paenibacillus turicensis]
MIFVYENNITGSSVDVNFKKTRMKWKWGMMMHLFLRNASFRKLSLANIFSVFGDKLYYLALITFVSTFEQANLAIGLVSISELFPPLLSTFTGYKADSTVNRGRYLLISGIARSFMYLIIGLTFTLQLSQWSILIIAVILNFISDTLGSYSSGLTTPLTVEVTGEKDYPIASGFMTGIGQIVGLIAQFIGVSLLFIASYSQLAFINASTFFISVLILLLFFKTNASLYKRQVSQSAQSTKQSAQLAQSDESVSSTGYLSALKQSFTYLKQEKQLLPIIISILMLNTALSSITPILQMMIAGNVNLIIFSYSLTVTIVGAVITVSMSIGGVFGVPLLKNYRLQSITFNCLIALTGFFLTLFLQNIYMICVFLIPVGFLVGVSIPKLSAWIVGAVARENLATSIGIINTILVGIAPLSTLVFVTVASTTSPMVSVTILIMFSVVMAVIQVVSTLKERGKKLGVRVGG